VDRLNQVIANQFEAAWSMLSESMEQLAGKGWRAGSNAHAIPARLAYHIIETADYYTHHDLEVYQWAGRFGVDWEVEDPEQLPAAEVMLFYLAEVRAKVADWLASLGEAGLLASDAVFHQEGMTHLDRALYVLRHTHQHLGELHALLHERGLPRPGWR